VENARFDYRKYRAFQPIAKPDRRWPDNVIQAAPEWCSVDLRDGNQALVEPMNAEQKLRLWELLVSIGFKQIEVGFPSASSHDFAFLRKLIEEDRIPDDVTVQVLVQARADLIEETFAALEGVKRAVVHFYNSTSTVQREYVFGLDRDGIRDIAVNGARLIKEAADARPETEWVFEYSPESFTGTEMDFAVSVCDAVNEVLAPTPDRPVIINLPATVEMSTPNIYADQIEWFCRNFPRRDSAVISLHTHNDRGTGVAATELGLMAGAQRVEGTLFGNGERTGNCDVITMAMNLFSQGVDPTLDFRQMPKIREVAESVNKLAVPERHPYAGDLVFTAFSGSHQDAIKKGMAQVDRSRWEVPYLPIDPADVGGSYKESIRVNSQSGKGGVGFMLEEHYGLALPRELLVEFSSHVQKLTESLDREVKTDEIYQCLLDTYVVDSKPYRLVDYDLLTGRKRDQRCVARVAVSENTLTIDGEGSGPIEAFVTALGETLNEPVTIQSFQEVAIGTGSDAQAICIVSIEDREEGRRCYGIGLSRNTTTTALNAIISAMNRRWSKT